MKFLLSALLSAVTLAAAHNTLSSKEIFEGWILLFDGETTFGWTPEGKAEWRVADGVLVADAGESGYLRGNSAFADYVFRCDFRTGPEGNSGIFLRSAKEGQPHVTGYELQIFNQHPEWPTASLVNHRKAKSVQPAPDQWHTYEVTVSGDAFLVKLDGKKVLETRDSKSRLGHFGLQYNKDRKIEFRNIRLKPLGTKPIFNGKDLSGWTVVDAPKPKEMPVWEARDGAIHVEKGPGQLETGGGYQDFILQLEIRTNARDASHHPNSGVFFRGDPKGFWTGYESQIRNEYKDGDRAKPVDFGTGGIYYRFPARRVVPNDNEYFVKTVVANGRHMATWVNGWPVADWEDDRAEGGNARQAARLAPGTLSLQAHDPTTNLDFRNLRIAVLPKP